MIPQSATWLAYNSLPYKQMVTVVTFSTYARVFTTQNTRILGQYPWITKLDGGGLRADDFGGWAQRAQFTITVQDYAGTLSTDFSTQILDGQTVTVTTGFTGMVQTDFMTALTLQVDRVEPTEHNNCFNIICSDLGIELNNPVYQTGDDGWPTGNNHTRQPSLPTVAWAATTPFITGNAYVDVNGFVQVVTTDGTSGGTLPAFSTTVGGFTTDNTAVWYNAGRSLQSPAALILDVLLNQVGYPSTRVNLAALAYYQNDMFPGLLLEFTLNSAPQAQEFLVTEIFKALYGYGYWNYAGQYTPYFHISEKSPSPSIDFWDGVDIPNNGFTSGLSSAIMSPLPTETAGDYYTTVSYKCDFDGNDYTSEIVSAFGTAEPFDLSRQQIIQAKGVRTPLGGALYARLVSFTLFQNYGLRPTLLEFEADWGAVAVEPGDHVSVSHPQIKNRLTGAVSLTHEFFYVESVVPNWEKGTVTIGCVDVEYLTNGPYDFAPGGTPVWTSSSPTQQKTYMYITNGAGVYSDGTAGNPIFP